MNTSFFTLTLIFLMATSLQVGLIALCSNKTRASPVKKPTKADAKFALFKSKKKTPGMKTTKSNVLNKPGMTVNKSTVLKRDPSNVPAQQETINLPRVPRTKSVRNPDYVIEKFALNSLGSKAGDNSALRIFDSNMTGDTLKYTNETFDEENDTFFGIGSDMESMDYDDKSTHAKSIYCLPELENRELSIPITTK